MTSKTLRRTVGVSLASAAVAAGLLAGSGTASAATGGGQCYWNPALTGSRYQVLFNAEVIPFGYQVKIVYAYEVSGPSGYTQVGVNESTDVKLNAINGTTICSAISAGYPYAKGRFTA